MFTILAPRYHAEVLQDTVRQAAVAASLKAIIGDIQITPAVNRIVVSTTVIGRAAKDRVVTRQAQNRGTI